MKFETLRHCCIHSHAKPCENISGQGGGERKSGVAKQRARPGQGGGKRADNADKQDRPGQDLDKAARPTSSDKAEKKAHGAATARRPQRSQALPGDGRGARGGHKVGKHG